MPMLEMSDVTKTYRTDLVLTRALDEVTLAVEEGEFVAVSGPSGSGKTTFLNVAGLLDTFDGGRYLLDGADVSALPDKEGVQVDYDYCKGCGICASECPQKAYTMVTEEK